MSKHTSERFRASCSFARWLALRRTPVTRSNPVLLVLLGAISTGRPCRTPPSSLPCHTFYRSFGVSLPLVGALRLPSHTRFSVRPTEPSRALASSFFLTSLGSRPPSNDPLARAPASRMARIIFIWCGLSRAAVARRVNRRLSRARGGADEGERRPLKSSWEPITRVTQGRMHRAAPHRKYYCALARSEID